MLNFFFTFFLSRRISALAPLPSPKGWRLHAECAHVLGSACAEQAAEGSHAPGSHGEKREILTQGGGQWVPPALTVLRDASIGFCGLLHPFSLFTIPLCFLRTLLLQLPQNQGQEVAGCCRSGSEPRIGDGSIGAPVMRSPRCTALQSWDQRCLAAGRGAGARLTVERGTGM